MLVHSSMGGEKKKTEGNPEHALFPAYYFSASAALGVLPLVDLSHLNARVASGKSGAAVFPSKQRARSRCCEHGDRSSSRDRCTQKRPLREHPPLHRRVPGGLPAVSRDRGGGRGPPWVRAAPRWLRRGCGAGTPPVEEMLRGGECCLPAFWSYLESKQCCFVIIIIII